MKVSDARKLLQEAKQKANSNHSDVLKQFEQQLQGKRGDQDSTRAWAA